MKDPNAITREEAARMVRGDRERRKDRIAELEAEVERLRGVANHWTTGGDLVVEQKTLFRQVGWLGQSGAFYLPDDQADAMAYEGGGYSPIYQQIAKWVEGEGWDD